MAAETRLAAGFADPVFDSQRCFRALLDAMCHPGRVQRLAPATGRDAPLPPAMAALALTLLDADTPVWLAGAPAAAWLAFHCGAPTVEEPAAAAFALVGGIDRLPALSAFPAGDTRFPDRSATVVVEVDGLAEGRGAALTGPGIETEARLDGPPARFWEDWERNAARYPAGVDVVLTSGERLAALPRSVRVAPCM